MSDRQRIGQVLSNLISNAARHSNESTAIRVTAAAEDFHVAVSVTDEGRGVPAERLLHLFRKFSRIEGGDRRREIEGTGLSLAICKGIVEAHGGRIWAESEGEGKGARFTFTLPVVDQDDFGGRAGRAWLSARPRRSDAEGARILTVDDDPLALRHVRDILSRAGYTPIVTADPEQALSLVVKEKPQLALLDLMLPGTDGIKLIPNPPKDTDGRREDSGRGWVRELQGRWPGVLG